MTLFEPSSPIRRNAAELAALKRAFPSATPEQLRQARESLHRYFELAFRTYRRLQAEGRFDRPEALPYDSRTKVDSSL